MNTRSVATPQRLASLGDIRMGPTTDRGALPGLLRGAHELLDRGEHTVTFTGGSGWVLRHPQSCPHTEARACPVSKAAHKTLLSGSYPVGSFACRVETNGWLRVTGGRR